MEPDVVVRTYPIRVGNEYTTSGELVGTSGPVYPDMKELTWEELSSRVGRPLLERTTVTAKVRRIFTGSPTQYRRMLQGMSNCQVMLNFCNYLHPTARRYEDLDRKAQSFIEEVHDMAWSHHAELSWMGLAA